MSTTKARTKATIADSDKTAPRDLSHLTDADALRLLWRLCLEGSIRALESGEANAACLSTARALLADQGVHFKSIQQLAPGPAIDLGGLPDFDD